MNSYTNEDFSWNASITTLRQKSGQMLLKSSFNLSSLVLIEILSIFVSLFHIY